MANHSAYRRYLRSTTGRRAFEIDPGKLADEAPFGGIFVLHTNARITPLQAVLRYRDLLQVEDLFRAAKALMCAYVATSAGPVGATAMSPACPRVERRSVPG